MKSFKLRSYYFSHGDTRLLCEFVSTTMLRFGGVFLVCVCTFMLKIFGFISKYLWRSKNEENGYKLCDKHSQIEDQVVSETSNDVLSAGKESLESKRGKDSCENIAETDDSVFLQSGWIANSSKYEFVSEKSVNGYIEEPETVTFMVQEIFPGSEENSVTKNLDCEIHTNDSLDQNLEISSQGFDEELDSSSFDFQMLFDACCSVNEDTRGDTISELDNVGEERHEENDSITLESASLEANDQAKLEDIKEDRDIDHTRVAIKDPLLERMDDEYIELKPLSVSSTDISKESFTNSEEMASVNVFKENKGSWDFDYDDEDESDVLSEHQNLVQQMKMELKNCRIRSLPTISEECETPKMVEDLKPLKIDQKFEYNDVMEEIQKFYKIYAEKMRKLDVLNYQTLNAISFLELKNSKGFSTCKRKTASARLNLSKTWPFKVRRIYADTMQKPVMDMHRDLELVYVGQLCLSWEILFWLYVKAQELMEHDTKGSHSYNRAAEEFQQFQVLMQRFIEDEPFQGPRILNYVKNRSMVRSLLHVPTIKDDFLKDKKERREEKDIISLKLLVEIIKESMLIFWEFLGAEKALQAPKVDLQNTDNSVILVDIITTLQKMDRRIREQMRSQNCIVKKLQKHQERVPDHELFASQVELRLVSRVLNLSRLTRDQVIWCQKKVNNISFVRRRVHVEPCFLLFPC